MVHQSDQSVHKKCQHQIKFDFATNRPADHQLAVSGNRCLDGLGLAKICARKCKPLVSNGAHAQRIYNARRLCTTRFSAIMCDGAKLWRSLGAFVPLSETCFRSARFHAMSVMKPPTDITYICDGTLEPFVFFFIVFTSNVACV